MSSHETHSAWVRLHNLVTQSQDSRSSSSKVLVGIVVVGRDIAVHALESLGGTLDASQQSLSASFGSVDHGRHPFESRGELETSLYIDLSGKLGLLVLGSDLIALGKLPVEGV